MPWLIRSFCSAQSCSRLKTIQTPQPQKHVEWKQYSIDHASRGVVDLKLKCITWDPLRSRSEVKYITWGCRFQCITWSCRSEVKYISRDTLCEVDLKLSISRGVVGLKYKYITHNVRTDAETQTQRRRDTDTKTQTPDAGAVTKNNADIESPTKSRCKVVWLNFIFVPYKNIIQYSI